MALTPTKIPVYQIQVGDPVSPTIANDPHLDLEGNIDNILSYLQDASTGYFEQNASTTTGLTFGFRAGLIRKNNTIVVVAGGALGMVASQTNYVEVDDAGTVASNTAGFTSGKIPLWMVVTDGSSITSVTDKRTPFTIVSASNIPFTPASGLVSTDVQAAVAESYSNASNVGIAFSVVFGS
jgi:hypothetical protein